MHFLHKVHESKHNEDGLSIHKSTYFTSEATEQILIKYGVVEVCIISCWVNIILDHTHPI